MKIILALLISVWFYNVENYTQQLSEMHVVSGSAKYLPDELVDKSIRDKNGEVCAGLMILSDLEGLSFDSYNGIIKRNTKPGQDFLFLSPSERVVTIYKIGYSPLKIILSEQGIKLASGQTWQVKVTGEKKSDLISISILVEPQDAIMILPRFSGQ
jgi:hypothetical protein